MERSWNTKFFLLSCFLLAFSSPLTSSDVDHHNTDNNAVLARRTSGVRTTDMNIRRWNGLHTYYDIMYDQGTIPLSLERAITAIKTY